MSRKRRGPLSEVARWHLLSGAPDNVTEEGDVVEPARGRRLQSQKELLRAEIARLHGRDMPSAVKSMARLAASYLLAGDVETARRYLSAAHELLSKNG